MTTCFDSEYKMIQYDPAHHILIATWKIAPSSREYRTGMMAMIDAMKQFNTGRLVYRTLTNWIILEEDQRWSAGEWRDLAVAAGHSKVAMILSDDIFIHMSAESMMEIADDKVAHAYFNRMEDAVRWVTISNAQVASKTML
ncbi:MAG TPA: hypothetical protein VIN08_25330 [Ohtaekwangia sp.]|uniref:hypothetical protein n=1 Tax=Ohtaekwangia sp. TaxID=2066019 RepID=UPI002F946264